MENDSSSLRIRRAGSFTLKMEVSQVTSPAQRIKALLFLSNITHFESQQAIDVHEAERVASVDGKR